MSKMAMWEMAIQKMTMGEMGPLCTKRRGAGWPWGLIPLCGVPLVLFLFLIVVPSSFDPEERLRTMAVAASWFAFIALVLLTTTDVVQASLGLGDWTSHRLGGFHYLGPTPGSRLSLSPEDAIWRSGWGWGAGLAWWASVGGLTACLIDLSRAVMGSRCSRCRTTASSSPGTV